MGHTCLSMALWPTYRPGDHREGPMSFAPMAAIIDDSMGT